MYGQLQHVIGAGAGRLAVGTFSSVDWEHAHPKYTVDALSTKNRGTRNTANLVIPYVEHTSY